MKRTYPDASVLIGAFREKTARALEILSDPERTFVVSDYLRLEVLPKPMYRKNRLEVSFMESVFADAERVPSSDELTSLAVRMASCYDMSPLDALHVAAAVIAGVDELVTLERPTKPMCNVREVRVVSLYG